MERLSVAIATSTEIIVDSAWITESAKRTLVETSMKGFNDYFVCPFN
jgi:hypothetical protein